MNEYCNRDLILGRTCSILLLAHTTNDAIPTIWTIFV